MKKRLAIIRKPNKKSPRAVRHTVLVLLLGVALGIFAKWLDELAIDDRVWWQLVIEKLDLGNVFSEMPVWLVLTMAIAVFSGSPGRAALRSFLFLLGMCLAYHVYAIVVAGFNPDHYMLIWYGIAACSPLLGAVCWYGKSAHNAAIAIDVILLAVLFRFCFSVGWVYVGLNGIVNAALFVVAVIVLYKQPKQILIAALGGAALAVAVGPLLPF